MKLTSQTNYAVRMLMFCHSKGDRAKVKEIAAFYGLPERFLFNILQRLTAVGLMETTRGRGGGIRLARPAEQIMLGDVVRLVEENFEMAECFEAGGTDCPLINTCGLNKALSEALRSFFDSLNRYSIADLTGSEFNIDVLMRLNLAMKDPVQGKAN
ncbi:Rrf2 family protein [Hoeflea phototrophica DFL-43]|jgi:Rrf2 family protein|uniref:Rrf2 family protein n=1 Tax=Hoeflea phototrophica (strain DSM 17068 / NCIMB 14078 / DFL-43) TaxID=411684 RepID=A9DGU7_HOEPD|nr:Rrf2 family transcriptional regulator [Hoeflea phototrophica]EDQ31551.1 Rrf2 family protein [Hoeflea phototrophica DFL-43]